MTENEISGDVLDTAIKKALPGATVEDGLANPAPQPRKEQSAMTDTALSPSTPPLPASAAAAQAANRTAARALRLVFMSVLPVAADRPPLFSIMNGAANERRCTIIVRRLTAAWRCTDLTTSPCYKHTIQPPPRSF